MNTFWKYLSAGFCLYIAIASVVLHPLASALFFILFGMYVEEAKQWIFLKWRGRAHG